MPILTITTDDGSRELVKLQIKEIDPTKAVVAILGAVDKLKTIRPPRKDKGTTRPPKPAATPSQPTLPGA